MSTDCDCGRYGSCKEGKCICQYGWFGPQCALPQEDCNEQVCSGRGLCRNVRGSAGQYTLVCECDPTCGFIGTACNMCPAQRNCQPTTGPCPLVPVPPPMTPSPSDNEGAPLLVVLAIVACILCLVITAGVFVRKMLQYRQERGGERERGGDRERIESFSPAVQPNRSSLSRAQYSANQQERRRSRKTISFADDRTGPVEREMEEVGRGVKNAPSSSSAPRRACPELELGADGLWTRRTLSHAQDTRMARKRSSSSSLPQISRGQSEGSLTDNPLQEYAKGGGGGGSMASEGSLVAADAASMPMTASPASSPRCLASPKSMNGHEQVELHMSDNSVSEEDDV